RGIGHFFAVVADINAPLSGAGVDQIPTLPVFDPDAAGLRDDMWPLLQVIDDRRIRVEHRFAIDVLKSVLRARLSILPPHLSLTAVTTAADRISLMVDTFWSS